MHNWRDDLVTEKQLTYIKEMNEFSSYQLPKFDGKTKGEASDYIDKYSSLVHENIWAIEHGY